MTADRAPDSLARSWSVFDDFKPPSRRTRPQPPNWTIFDEFARPRSPMSWQTLDDFVHQGQQFAAERCRAFPALLERWDTVLADLDGDPCRADWSDFRPLHVDREEDWSDWLQHFIATSSSGTFSYQLFGRSAFRDAACCVRPEVRREKVIDDRRADLVIRWGHGHRTHVEVKVGDRSFAKTPDTASKLERAYPPTIWTHYILLPSWDLAGWNAEDHAGSPAIHAVTWDDVAIAFRRSLRRRDEARQWRSWALGFCGLVEQRLLGHLTAGKTVASLHNMERRMHQISVMKRGLDDV